MAGIFGSFLCLGVLGFLLTRPDAPHTGAVSGDPAILDHYDTHIRNTISTALQGMLEMDKVYWLRDQDPVAPRPKAACYGEAASPAEMEEILEQAEKLPAGQTLMFSPDTEIYENSTVRYYLDETIFAVTWKEVRDYCVYTFSEVKIAHPSQFRRFLAGGSYEAQTQFTTTEMAENVNAVVASSGDFFRFRQIGNIVYQGQVRKVDPKMLDTCYVDEQGDLHLTRAGQIPDRETAERFVAENKIRFSLNFGPILVEQGQQCEPYVYPLGEVSDHYARAALCQMGRLHYLLVTANSEWSYRHVPDIHDFAKNIHSTGCVTAYALDGGQTAAIVMDNRLINSVVYGEQRHISDIIYFATALPSEVEK